MFNVTMVAENRHTVLRRPLDASQIKNFQTFAPTELIDVQASADILTHDIMPHREDDATSGMAVIV